VHLSPSAIYSLISFMLHLILVSSSSITIHIQSLFLYLLTVFILSLFRWHHLAYCFSFLLISPVSVADSLHIICFLSLRLHNLLILIVALLSFN
jgi:hypothetical protein